MIFADLFRLAGLSGGHTAGQRLPFFLSQKQNMIEILPRTTLKFSISTNSSFLILIENAMHFEHISES